MGSARGGEPLRSHLLRVATCVVLMLQVQALAADALLPMKVACTNASTEASQHGLCQASGDGWQPDCRGRIPCKNYFLCSQGQPYHWRGCPEGQAFDSSTRACRLIRLAKCHCSSTIPAATAGFHKLPPNMVSRRNREAQRSVQETPSQEPFLSACRRYNGAGRPCDRLSRRSEKVGRLLRMPLGFLVPKKVQGTEGLSEGPGGRGLYKYRKTPWPQVNALLALRARVADPVGVLSSWNVPQGSQDPLFVCDWKGIRCEPERNRTLQNMRVVSLVLSNEVFDEEGYENPSPLWGLQNLPSGQGSLPPEIGLLTALTELDVSSLGRYRSYRFRGLVGPFPEQVFNCRQLQRLVLKNNFFSGSIPSGLSTLSNIQHLDLSYNIFSSSSLEFLCQLQRLTFLDWSSNNVTGFLPSCLVSLTGLASLSVKRTAMTGSIPESIGSMTTLSELILENIPYISGSIPDSISRLSNLEKLSLSALNLSGDLPAAPWWVGLAKLQYVTLSSVPVAGSLPSRAGKSISVIQINNTLVSGPIRPSLQESLCNPRRSVQLAEFTLANNQLSGPFPSLLSKCQNLAAILLQNNKLTGKVPRSFFPSFTYLQAVQLQDNRFTGPFPTGILSQQTGLTTLNLARNRFTGPCPVLECSIVPDYGLINPSEFDVSSNFFEGYAEDVLRLNTCISPTRPMFSINISNNRIGGKIPPNWAVARVLDFSNNNISASIPVLPAKLLYNVDRLGLQGNLLSGPIPAWLLQSSRLQALDLSRNNLNGTIPQFLGNQALISLDLSRNNLSGSIPSSITKLGFAASITLSSNSLSGPLPGGIASLPLLRNLDLSRNNLSAEIPGAFGNIRPLTSLSLAYNSFRGSIPGELAPQYSPGLRFLDLSSNMLQGSIPLGFNNSTGVVLSGQLNLSGNNLSGPVPLVLSQLPEAAAILGKNPLLCGGAGYAECPEYTQDSEGLSVGAIVGISVGAVALGCGVAALVLWMCLDEADPWAGGVMLSFHGTDIKIRDLLEATNHFDAEFLLGAGGFGAVYRAELRTGQVYAVKRLNVDAVDGQEDFKAEVMMLGEVSHRNIVQLIAAFLAKPPALERLLVYEYMSGGSLDKVLVVDMPEASPFHYLEVRRSVALDVARGLRYLHHYCNPQVIHRDIKPANVLLDGTLIARVADFGLAKHLSREQSHGTEQGVLGTAGFVAPEYTMLRRWGAKSDVYAFGVTLIQLITGRRTTDEDIVERGLTRWVARGASIVDPNVTNLQEDKMKLALAMVQVGILCIARIPVDRPTMEDVVYMLENLEEFAQGFEGFQDGHDSLPFQSLSAGL